MNGVRATPHLNATSFVFESDMRDEARAALSAGTDDFDEVAFASKAILAVSTVFVGSLGSTFTYHVRALRHSNPAASNDALIRQPFEKPSFDLGHALARDQLV